MENVAEQEGYSRSADRPEPPGPQAGQCPRMIVLFVALTLGVLGGDLLLKYVSFQHVASQPVQLEAEEPGVGLPPHEAVELVPGVLHLRLTTNEGAIFGLGQGYRWMFVGVSIVAVLLITHIFWRSSARAWGFHLGLALILGGALGNLYDRVRYSQVRDMLWIFPETHLPFGLSWPGGVTELWPWIFNLADAALVAGVILVVTIMWWRELRPQSAESGSG